MKIKEDKLFIPGYAEEEEEPKLPMVRCESCGALNDGEAEFCCECGQLFGEDEDDAEDAEDDDSDFYVEFGDDEEDENRDVEDDDQEAFDNESTF